MFLLVLTAADSDCCCQEDAQKSIFGKIWYKQVDSGISVIAFKSLSHQHSFHALHRTVLSSLSNDDR